MDSAPSLESRRAQLRANVARVRERISNACASAGRNPAEITLVGVTKTYSATDAQLLVELGVVDLGENRDQEARGKAEAVPAARWHFVGQLQRNKTNSVAAYASVVQSVDRPELVAALERSAVRHRRELEVLIQVNLDSEPGLGVLGPRGGVVPAQVLSLARYMESCSWLRLRGLMGVAPRQDSANYAFSQLRALSKELCSQYPDARWISAGMSSDLEEAVSQGATHLRIGGALLGKRV